MKNYIVEETGKIIYKYKLGSYLVVFDRPIRWETNVKVMNWVALLSGNSDLQRYVRMQCIKRSSTNRISEKRSNYKVKPIPKVVFRYGKQYRKIQWFLETRKFLLDSLKRLKKNNEQNKALAQH
jgi:hypothetical protein